MKKLLFLLLLLTAPIYSQFEPFSFFGDNYNKETVAFAQRVQADGGTNVNKQEVDRLFTQIKRLGLKDNVRVAYDPTVFGVKKDQNGYISKLYNPFYKESADLITNQTDKDFSSDTGFWVKGTGVTINDGVVHMSNASGWLLKKTLVQANKLYKVTFTIPSYTSGAVRVLVDGAAASPDRTSIGTFSTYITGTGVNIGLWSSTTFTGDIDNFSVKEVLNPDLEQTTASNQPQFRSFPALPFAYQIGLNGVDQYPSVTPKTLPDGSGSLDFNGPEKISTGNKDFESTINLGSELVSNGNLSIDKIGYTDNGNHSAQRITTDDVTGSGACLEVTSLGAGDIFNNLIKYNPVPVALGKSYYCEIYVKSVSGNATFHYQVDNVAGNSTTITTSWTKLILKSYSGITSSNATARFWIEGSGVFRLDGFSVKEILSNYTSVGNHTAFVTGEDKKSGTYSLKVTSAGIGDATANYTYLPAAKYDTVKTGKKYTLEAYARGTGILNAEKNPDVTCDVASSWVCGTGWSVSGGVINANNVQDVSTYSNQYGIYAGKTYRIVYTLKTYSAGRFRVITEGGGSTTVDRTATGTYTDYLVATVNGQLYFNGRNGFTGTVDDISVKEVTPPTLTMLLGGKSVSSTVSCVPGSFSKLVLNFQATASEVNQPIKFYSNQADAVYVDDVSLTEYHPATISGWFKTANSNLSYILSKQTASNTFGYGFVLWTGNKLNFSIIHGSGAQNDYSGTKVISDNQWHHYAVVLDNDILKVYIDGALDGTLAYKMGNMNNTQPFTIGRASFAGANYWIGSLGPQRITRDYTYTLSDVQAEFASGLLYTPPSGQIVCQYDWTDFKDRSAIGNDLTNNGNIQSSTTTADKRGLIYFDGSNDFMKTPLITLNQPTTVYVGIRQNVWGDARYIFDAYAFNSTSAMGLYQRGSAPNLRIASNSNSIDNNNLPVNIFGYTKIIFNGTNSLIQINNGTSSTGTLGTTSSNGFTMGSRSDLTNYGSFETGPVIILDCVPNAAQDAWIKSYLFNKWGIK